jgi:hypothetical protein
VGSNMLGEAGAARLADVLASLGAPRLESLHLQGNALGDEGITRLAAAFETGACQGLKVRAWWTMGRQGAGTPWVLVYTRALDPRPFPIMTCDSGRRSEASMLGPWT